MQASGHIIPREPRDPAPATPYSQVHAPPPRFVVAVHRPPVDAAQPSGRVHREGAR